MKSSRSPALQVHARRFDKFERNLQRRVGKRIEWFNVERHPETYHFNWGREPYQE